MKLKKDELIKEVKDYTGDRTDDETLKLIEDVSDSFTDSEEGSVWEAKYNDLARKYKERFSETVVKDEEPEEDKEEEKKEIKDLFTEEN